MAQTKRRRRTKHRGNAAGVVESRGRTGRPPTKSEKSARARESQTGRERRMEKYDRPPTWRSAFQRAMIASLLLLLIGLFLIRSGSAVVAFFPVALLVYTPISYYTDLYLYGRRQRQKQQRQKQKKS